MSERMGRLGVCVTWDYFLVHLLQGVVINYSEPAEARIPKTRWRLYGFKGEEELRK